MDMEIWADTELGNNVLPDGTEYQSDSAMIYCLLNPEEQNFCQIDPQGKFKIFKSVIPHAIFVPWIQHDYSWKIYHHINAHFM